MYSVHTDLDSFILCNDESLKEPESENIDTDEDIEPIDLDIMAALDLEENEEEPFGQHIESETQNETEV